MQAILEKLSLKTFILVAIIICLFTDIAYLSYIYLKFSNHQMFIDLITLALKNQNINIADLPPGIVEDQFYIFLNVLRLSMAVVLFFHLFTYLLFSRQKAVAFKYIKLITVLGIVFSPILAISLIQTSPTQSGIFFIVTLLTYFNWLGFNKFLPNGFIAKTKKSEQ